MPTKEWMLIIDGNLFARKMFYKFRYLKSKTTISDLIKHSPNIIEDINLTKSKKTKYNKIQTKFNEENGESRLYREKNDTDNRIEEIINNQKIIEIMTGITFGMIRSLIAIYRTYPIKYTVICYDPTRNIKEQTRKDFRSSISTDYKANRESKDVYEFSSQLKLAQHLLFLLGIEQSWTNSFEADDLLQFYSKVVFKKNKCLLLTSDHDLYQCLSNKDSLLFIGKTSKIYSKSDFIKEYGILPNQYKDVLSLCGCGGDNVNGIVGIGKAKAIEIIKEFNSIKNLKKEFPQKEDKISKGSRALLRVESKNKYQTINITRKLISLYGSKPGFEKLVISKKIKSNNFDNFINILKQLKFNSILNDNEIKTLKNINSKQRKGTSYVI